MNSGINRGLRRSKGVGFRENGQHRSQNSRDGQSSGIVRRSADPPSFSKPQMTNDGWKGGFRQDSTEADTGRSPVRIKRGKKLIKDEEYLSLSKKHRSPGKDTRQFKDSNQYERRSNPRGYDQDRHPAPSNPDYGAARLPPFSPRGSSVEKGYQQSENRGGPRRYDQDRRPASSNLNYGATRLPSFSPRGLSPENEPQDQHQNSEIRHPTLSVNRTSGFPGRDREPSSHTQQHPPKSKYDDASSTGPRSSDFFDKRMPLSIPYTTPASEFLYGTSVVEAALHSQREPRRKLYKLYIYTGENRENTDPAGLERLARRKGIQVARVGLNWLRVLDKMSGGRPHNGYVLEASPLPRLPVAELGEMTEQDGERGFKITLEHQSREDAAVNGTSDFIKLPRNSSRNPFILFLDSIEDPGNLGGIIRTAAFLGVTAVAFSVRNSASFTPVVLKASAGASENVTLFAVSKPSGFIANSKQAGWKIFAAVAPTTSKGPHRPLSITVDDLKDPLSSDPCILMLGGEGEGLRANLRSKADVELSIRGRGRSHNVDSLNVSVAAGILCDTFLRRKQGRMGAAQPDEAPESDTAAESDAAAESDTAPESDQAPGSDKVLESDEAAKPAGYLF